MANMNKLFQETRIMKEYFDAVEDKNWPLAIRIMQANPEIDWLDLGEITECK